jgi:hypothetical protein
MFKPKPHAPREYCMWLLINKFKMKTIKVLLKIIFNPTLLFICYIIYIGAKRYGGYTTENEHEVSVLLGFIVYICLQCLDELETINKKTK